MITVKLERANFDTFKTGSHNILIPQRNNACTLSLEIDNDNIEALEAACKKYREETRLPETMADVIDKLAGMQNKIGEHWFLADVGASGTCATICDNNAFPARWQAEKLHALACMEQVWIALHNGDFEWLTDPTQNEVWYHSIAWHSKEVETRWNNKEKALFPFRTRELAEQARKILTDGLIKTAFKVA